MDAAQIMAALTPPPTVDPSTTIKMEDLHQTPFTSAPSHADTSSPAPAAHESKAVKKRKSWGQVLPEPKTNLPPRKRAKTDDEKEQRRIERVKRNRLAAHNSRERKRQEYELLQAEKDQMEEDLIAARRQIAAMATELKAYRQKYPGEVPEANLSIDLDNTSVSEYSSFTSPDTINPAKTTSSTGFPSPVSMTLDSFDSPRDSSCAPETPNFSEAAVDFDQTRYPAEIFAHGLPVGDMGFPVAFQSHTPMDNKPIEDLFDFDQFQNTELGTTTGLVDSDPFFTPVLFDGHHAPDFDLSDHLDAKHFDLQTASGAATASDEALAA
ncbi:transcription factor that binds to CRE motif [Didymosphaeria variabile]|uniref:Transcription factor that binds to CRE motif n=1 Tax=Didymosphaeria variabile TaxID=1932322 RepID=A0A9W9C8T8_9PLEO|nr:transcription factor that binds to CRE motif [Didymosphaeria variabile]KAJ4349808.1 transcription factor that binds to CRE motif [Didymosphaeria variabile]